MTQQREVLVPPALPEGAFQGQDMSLTAVVCANGLGHYYRATGILREVQTALPDLDISVVTDPTLFAAGNDSPASHALWMNGARQVSADIKPGVRWSTEAADYDDGSLLGWESAIAGHPALRDASVVLSDNLGGVRAQRPDALLSGNFAWWDILSRAHPDSEAVAQFAERERELMAGATMLCVGAIASQAVLEDTEAVPVGWMLQKPEPPQPKGPDAANHVAVYGGGTGAADELLAEAAIKLIEDPRRDWMVHMSPRLYYLMPQRHWPRIVSMASGFNGYNECGAVLLRPAAGSMMASVEAGAKMVALAEPNPEMDDNGRSIERLGIGRYLGSDPTDVVDAVTELTQGGTASQEADRRLREQPRNGIAEAGRFLVDHIRSLRG